MRIFTRLLSAALLLSAAACAATAHTPGDSTTTPTTQGSAGVVDSPAWWMAQTASLHGHPSMNATVFSIIIPRDDLWVQSQMGDIPTAAGISDKFYFYRCNCGLIRALGEFVVADYEANDVMQSLAEGNITVTSMAPMLMNEKPRLLVVRYQAEGTIDALVHTLHSALRWTGPARSATQPDKF